MKSKTRMLDKWGLSEIKEMSDLTFGRLLANKIHTQHRPGRWDVIIYNQWNWCLDINLVHKAPNSSRWILKIHVVKFSCGQEFSHPLDWCHNRKSQKGMEMSLIIALEKKLFEKSMHTWRYVHLHSAMVIPCSSPRITSPISPR